MDLSLESALTVPGAAAEPSGNIAGRPLDEWNAAYAKVESYFHALRIRNKVLLGRLVIHVLKRAMRRAPQDSHLSATELAAEDLAPSQIDDLDVADRQRAHWLGEGRRGSRTERSRT